MKSSRPICIAIIILLCSASVYSQEPLKPLKIQTAPTIDGILDDAVWSEAPHITSFKTFLPDFGKTLAEKTDVAMAYDEENLYFAWRCYEPHPEQIKTSVAARDGILNDDFVCLNLDSFGDQQSMYALYVNPSGIQADSRFAAGIEDFSQDLVWYSAGRVDSLGYTVEMQIPLKSIRYRDGDPVKMAVLFERCISRRQEHTGYPEMNPAMGFALLPQLAPMVYSGVKHYTLLEILPAATYGQQYRQSQGALVSGDPNRKMSLTTKYGVTSDLILDGTYNPDFSQVEADAGQVDINLRYSLYYPEKRPFFLEGKEMYTVGGTAMSNDEGIDPIRAIVHTRTIADPLLGMKLSGKLDDASTISMLYAVDKVIEADRSVLGDYSHVPILRYKRALNQDSYVGALYAGNEWSGQFNRVAGIDEQYRVSDGGMIESSGFLSWAHDHVSGRSTNGYTAGGRYLYGARNLDYELDLRDVSEDFRADMGYITRTGITSVAGLFRPKIFPGGGPFQKLSPEVYSAQVHDKVSDLWETSDQVALNTLFGSMAAGVRYTYSTEIYSGRTFYTGGLTIAARGQLTKSFSFYVSARRGRSIYYADLLQGKSNRVSATLTYQPSDHVQAEGSLAFADFTHDETGARLYSYPIERLKLTFQPNKYLFFRGIGEYNDYRKEMNTDFLASFTYIPGTVIFLGYGSVFDKVAWDGNTYAAGENFLQVQSGYFFKTSYLWRM